MVYDVVVVRYRLSWCLKPNRKLFVSFFFFFNVQPTLEPPRYYYTRLFCRQCWFDTKYLLDVIISRKLRTLPCDLLCGNAIPTSVFENNSRIKLTRRGHVILDDYRHDE